MVVDVDRNTSLYSPKGELLSLSSERELEIGYGSFMISYLTKDSEGNIMAITRNSRIVIIDSERVLFTIFGGKGKEDGKFNGLSCLARGKRRRIYTTDRYNNRVQVFGEMGNFLYKFSGVMEPYGIAVNSREGVIVSEVGSPDLKMFDKRGKFLMSFSSFSQSTCLGISFTSDNNLLTTDFLNNKVRTIEIRPPEWHYTLMKFYSLKFQKNIIAALIILRKEGLPLEICHEIIKILAKDEFPLIKYEK